MTHYTVSVGPGRPGRHRLGDLIAETKDDSVFRHATGDEELFRIAAEVGVGRNTILGATSVITAAAPDRAPDAVPDRAPDAAGGGGSLPVGEDAVDQYPGLVRHVGERLDGQGAESVEFVRG